MVRGGRAADSGGRNRAMVAGRGRHKSAPATNGLPAVRALSRKNNSSAWDDRQPRTVRDTSDSTIPPQVIVSP